MRRTSLREIHKLARHDQRVVFIGSDVAHGTLEEMKAEMPDRFFMEGISEGGLIGLAAGLAMNGRTPFVNTIAVFLTRRCLEQIILDVCTQNLSVRLLANGGGLVYAPLGITHLATDDFALLRAIPNMTILAPADAEEMKRLIPATASHEGPIYIRLGKGGDPIITPPDQKFEIGRCYLLKQDGPDLLFVSTGVMSGVAMNAAEKLSQSGIHSSVLHMPTVKPLDTKVLLDHAQNAKLVISVEEHLRTGGLGSAVVESIADAGLSIRVERLGIPDRFVDRYGSQKELWAYFGIDADGIVQSTMRLLQEVPFKSRKGMEGS